MKWFRWLPTILETGGIRLNLSHNRVSAIVIAKDEERHIAECLDSLSFADETVVVVDSESRDRTLDIVKRYTTRVFVETWKGYAETKQIALEKTSNSWILWVDADERVTVECAAEIVRTVSSGSQYSGYRFRRKAFFLGKWIRHGGWYPGFVVRLFRKDRGRFNRARVHEGLDVDGPIGTLESPILHYTDDTLEQYVQKLNAYTTLAAQELFERNKAFRLSDLIFRPLHMFMKMYVFKAGFLDGMEGWILAVLSGNYVLVKYAKLWELHRGSKKVGIGALPAPSVD